MIFLGNQRVVIVTVQVPQIRGVQLRDPINITSVELLTTKTAPQICIGVHRKEHKQSNNGNKENEQ